MKKRLFLSSAVMTGVLAVALSTGTFAWYNVAGQGYVKTTNVSEQLDAKNFNYGGLGGEMDITTSFKAVNSKGKMTEKGVLENTDSAHSYDGDDKDTSNNLYNGLAQEGTEFDLPTWGSTTDGEGKTSTGLQPVDLTNSKGHTYANSDSGLVDITEQALRPYGAFTFTADGRNDVKLNKEQLGQSAMLTKVKTTNEAGEEVEEAVSNRRLELTITVQATGHVRLAKEEKNVFSNPEGNALYYKVIISGSDGSIEFGSSEENKLTGTEGKDNTYVDSGEVSGEINYDGIYGVQFPVTQDETEKVTIAWTFDNIYYSVGAHNKQNNKEANANESESAGHNGGVTIDEDGNKTLNDSQDGIVISWTSKIVD